MSVKPTEHFLEALEKKISAQKVRFCQNISASFHIHFFKISIFFAFPDI
eukprot:UN11998